MNESAHLHVDAELCVELGRDLSINPDAGVVRAAIARCWPALEIVDLAPRIGEPESLIVANLFHEAVAFGARPIPLAAAESVDVRVNGHPRERATWPSDIVDRLQQAALVLAGVGERLRAGDRIITGSIVQVPVEAGDIVRAGFGEHANIDLELIVRANGT